MLVGIISDTHDRLDYVRRAMEEFKKLGVEHILHCGDLVAPFVLPLLKLEGVSVDVMLGNNEGELVLISKRCSELGFSLHTAPCVLTIDNRRFFVSHEPVAPDVLGRCGEFDIVAFGHTHKRELYAVGNTIIVNPGEACGWLTGEATFAVYDTDLHKVKVYFLGAS